jgi:hypothetical protein
VYVTFLVSLLFSTGVTIMGDAGLWLPLLHWAKAWVARVCGRRHSPDGDSKFSLEAEAVTLQYVHRLFMQVCGYYS